MIWVIWVSLCAVFMLVAFVAKDWPRLRSLWIIFCGLGLVRVTATQFSDPATWVADALIWIMAGFTVGLIANGKHWNFNPLIPVLLVLAGLCLPLGRLAGEGYAFGSVAMLFSDLFGAAALIWLGCGSLVGFAHRVGGMGGSRRIVHHRSAVSDQINL